MNKFSENFYIQGMDENDFGDNNLFSSSIKPYDVKKRFIPTKPDEYDFVGNLILSESTAAMPPGFDNWNERKKNRYLSSSSYKNVDEEIKKTYATNNEETGNEEIVDEEQDKTQDPMITAMVGAASQAIEGLTGIASGLIGQRKRKAEQRAAKRDFDNQMTNFRAIDTSNPFANVQNTYEDLTVNQQQAQFEAQQQQLGMATAMGQMRGAAGSSGVAAMAQAMANQQSMNLQKSAASIGQQESRNQALAAQGGERREALLAQGEQESRRMEFAKQNRMLDLTSDRKIAADEAVAAAQQSMISGFGNLLGGGAAGAITGASELGWFDGSRKGTE